MKDLWVGGMYKPRRQIEKGEGVVEMYTILNNSFSVKLTKYKWGWPVGENYSKFRLRCLYTPLFPDNYTRRN